MTAGVLMVVGLLVGLYVGARWARLGRAVADLRSARANLRKASSARRQAIWGFTFAGLFAALLFVLYLISMTTFVISDDGYVP